MLSMSLIPLINYLTNQVAYLMQDTIFQSFHDLQQILTFPAI